MTRKKVTLAYISNDSERKASFKKRKKGLIKKVSELSTLCDVKACAIIYSQYDEEPAVWPSTEGAKEVLTRFHQLSEMEQMRKMVNQESFTRQRIKKTQDQLRRVNKENKRRDLETLMYQCLAGVSTLHDIGLRYDAADMGWVVNLVLRDVEFQIETMGAKLPPEAAPSAPPPPPLPLPLPLPSPPPSSSLHLLGEESLEGFPWNLMAETAPMGGGLAGSDVHGIGLPYSYMLNHGESESGPGPN